MDNTSSPPPLAHNCSHFAIERPKKFGLPKTPVAAVGDKISDSCAESSLSSSAASSPAAWDSKDTSIISPPDRRALPPQEPEKYSLETTAKAKDQGGAKRLHAALSPVDEDDAAADLRAKRRKLVLTLQDAEADGLTNWYSSLVLYGESIEHPAALRAILDEAVKRGISYLSPAEIKSITAFQDDEHPPQPGVYQCSFQDPSISSRVPSPPVLLNPAAGHIHPSTPGSSKPSEAPAPITDNPPNSDSYVSARPPPRHPSGWTPVNWEEPEEDGGNNNNNNDDDDDDDCFHDAAQRTASSALSDDADEDDEDAAVALPEVGDCFRSRTYAGGHPGTTWAAMVGPLVLEDSISNMQAGRKVMALRRAREKEAAVATAAPKRKRTPQTASPETRQNKRQKRKEEEEGEGEATQLQASGKAEEADAGDDHAGNLALSDPSASDRHRCRHECDPGVGR